MTVFSVRRHFSDILKKSGIENYGGETDTVVSFILQKDLTFLLADPDSEVKSSDIQAIEKIINRRIKNEPLQYILGYCDFMDLRLKVNESVLIPRQDTEIAVTCTIDIIKNNFGGKAHVLDICTGSGCIALSLLNELSDISCVASDISGEALSVAMSNATALGLGNRLKLLQSDLFEDIPQSIFDIIISNPPYIPHDDIDTLDECVRTYEPLLALDGGADGLDFYISILNSVKAYTHSGSYVVFETGINMAASLMSVMRSYLTHVECIKDYNGIDRVCIGIV